MSLELKKIKLIAFDWDGTLINSLDEVIQAFQKTCEYYDMPIPDKNAIRQNIGLGHDDIWARLRESMGSGFKIPKREVFWKQFYGYYRPDKVNVFDGVKESLHTLIDHGIGLAIVTNKPSFSFLPEVNAMGLRTYFLDCLCADQYVEKPDPMMLRVLSARQNITANNILMVGDTTFDLDAANAFGCQGIGVTCGNMNEQELLTSKPAIVFKNINELAKMIEEVHPLVGELDPAY
ncbi:MAG TPA: HAD family hydrolase [Gammaproteobacteria bacterium]|nr:HAD family hydrolase [Gammaproteobacteria bacterium]